MTEAAPFSEADPLADATAYAMCVAAEVQSFLEGPLAGSRVWEQATDRRKVSGGSSYYGGSYESTRYAYTTTYRTEVDGWGSVTVAHVFNEKRRSHDYSISVVAAGNNALGSASAQGEQGALKVLFDTVEAAWKVQQVRCAQGILHSFRGGIE